MANVKCRDQNDEAERETLKKEFVWLLENEYTRKVADIKRSMEECAKKFVPVFQPVTSDKDIRPIIFRPSQTGDDSISYKVSLDGDQIWRADITIKLAGRKTHKTGIKEHSAWKLKQIQDCANYFQVAQKQFNDILQSSSAMNTPKQIQKAFGDFISTLRQAVEVLVVPQLPDVKEVYSAELRGQLKPELPEDVALFFYISSDSLVLSVLIAATTQKGNTKNAKDQTTSYGSWVGATYDVGSITYEVTGHQQVSSPVRWLQDVLAFIKDAQELAQELIDKVQTFDAYGLEE
ncbi:hypothetical protein EMCRGX_G023917 [Ephydatia muelleri]